MSSLGVLRRLPGALALSLARASSRSCAGPEPGPAAPPCVPHPRPPCRPPPPCSTANAVRVVCCAPPRGRRPPCDPRPPRPHLACSDAKSDEGRACAGAAVEGDVRCGGGQDRVARRLAAALAARRHLYELDAAERACARSAAPERRPYAPGASRDCLRATDGRTYALPCAPARTARCGPGRTPPPPELVSLSRDPACRLTAAPDPCAHRPRTIVEVDRGDSTVPAAASPTPPPVPDPPAATPPAPSPATCGSEPVATRGLAERIVAGLRGQPPRRALHTVAPGCGAGSLSAGAEGQGDRSLRAAGRGRESVPCASGARAAPPPSAGRLELAVPAGATRLSVLVSLASGAGAGAGAGGACAAVGKPGAGMEPTPGSGARGDSWLSIRSLQRKLSGCGGDASGPASPPRPKVSPSCPNAKPPPRSVPPPPSNPCAPKSSPKPSPCGRGGASKKV